jgi:hypothetical protein
MTRQWVERCAAGQRGDDGAARILRQRQDGQADQDAADCPRRYDAGEPLPHLLTINARDDADHRIGAHGDEGNVGKEQRAEWRTDKVERVGVQHVEERARPQQQTDEVATSREPERGEQDWQSDDEVVGVLGEESWHEQPGLGFGHADGKLRVSAVESGGAEQKARC